jgi:hypothetical protein
VDSRTPSLTSAPFSHRELIVMLPAGPTVIGVEVLLPGV